MVGGTDGGQGVSRSSVTWAVALIGVAGVTLTVVNAALFADGAYFLLDLIQHRNVTPPHGREVVNAVREWPVLVALGLGVDHVRGLALIQSAAFVGLPVLAWSAAFYASRRSAAVFGLVALTCAVCFGTGSLFSVSELTLTIPLVVLATVLLSDADAWGLRRAIACIACAVVLLAAYEFMVFWGPVLMAQALLLVVRLRARSSGTRRVAAVGLVIALAAAGTAVAAYTLAVHPNPNSEGFMEGLRGIDPGGTPAVVAASVGAIIVAVLWDRSSGPSRVVAVALGVGVLLVFAAHAQALWQSPGAAYLSRIHFAVMVLGLQVLVLAHAWRPVRAPRFLVPAALGLLALSMVSPVLFAVGWHGFLTDFRATVTTGSSVIEPTEAVSVSQQRYLWGWSNSSLSVIVRSRPGNGVVTTNRPASEWVPFDPGEADELLPIRFRW